MVRAGVQFGVSTFEMLSRHSSEIEEAVIYTVGRPGERPGLGVLVGTEESRARI